MNLKKSGSDGLKKAAISIVIGTCSIFALYLVLPENADTFVIEDNAANAHNREDFYTEYLNMVQEVSNGTVDATEATLSQSVLNTSTATLNQTKGDWQTQLAMIDQKYPGYSSNFKEDQIDGNAVYLRELQGTGYWKNCRANNGSTMSGAGCFYFAASGLITNKTGTIYTVADILLAGHSECRNVTLNFDTAKGFFIKSGVLDRVGGSISMLQEVLDKSPLKADVKFVAGSCTGLTGKVNKNLLNQGTWYFLHVKDNSSKGVLSDGGEHWLVLIGSDQDNYYFGNNANRGVKVNKAIVDKLNFTQVWEIEIK